MCINKEQDRYFLKIAEVVAEAATCNRLSVGAVIVKEGKIIATGYNSAPYGKLTCKEVGCLHDKQGRCKRTLHAEAAAIISSPIKPEGATIYVTHYPCEGCANLILGAGIKRIVYLNHYDNEITDQILQDFPVVQWSEKEWSSSYH